MVADISSVTVEDPLARRRDAISLLEARLAAIPRAERPHEHAAAAYHLGLALAEFPGSDPTQGLRRALACYDLAASIFDPRFDPVEHARVINAAGAAHRALGNPNKSAALFAEAARLLEGHDRDDERAAALNNLGLVLTDVGDPRRGVEAFDAALELFDAGKPAGRRARVAALHNRGLAHASEGTEQALERALSDYEQAVCELDVEDAPYYPGLLHHSIGVAWSTLATIRDSQREQLLGWAIEAFRESLRVFIRTRFPQQHAMAKHNLGLAWGELGRARCDPLCLRRALVSFEDAATTFDPRAHPDEWRNVYANLERVEAELGRSEPDATRATHFAILAGAVGAEERSELVRERLLRLVSLPEPSARSAIAELAIAIASLRGDSAVSVMAAELSVLMELPSEALEVALRAQHEAHRRLAPESREHADRALDQAIGAALGTPQRIFVRDFLYSLGWERP